MKSLIKPLVFISSLAFFACNSNSTSSGSDATSAKTDSTKTDSSTALNPVSSKSEQDFINYAVPANTKEIIWLEAAIKQAHNSEVKEHAKMMLKDHKKLDETVKNYLTYHSGISVPSVDTTNVVDIKDKKGKDWDKAWSDKMVMDHSDLLGKLKQSQSDIKDTALSSIITNTIPVVESHLAMAKTLQNKFH